MICLSEKSISVFQTGIGKNRVLRMSEPGFFMVCMHVLFFTPTEKVFGLSASMADFKYFQTGMLSHTKYSGFN